MQINYPISLAAAFGLTFLLPLMLRPAACRIGLVDYPGDRKLHGGAVPLIGGIAMFIASCLSALTIDPAVDAVYSRANRRKFYVRFFCR